MNLAVLLQLVGLIVILSMGVVGYVLGPFLIIVGAVLYRRARKRKRDESDSATKRKKLNTRRKVLIGLGVYGVFILIGIGALFYLRAEMTKAAEGFLSAVHTRNMNRAETYLAEEFRAKISLTKLKAFLANSMLTQYQHVEWSSRSFSGRQGELIGTVSTYSGDAIPLRVRMVWEHGSWKIYEIVKLPLGTKQASKASYNH